MVWSEWYLRGNVDGADEKVAVHYESQRATAASPRSELDQSVLYKNREGLLENSVVENVRINAKLEPFYENRLDDGRLTETVGSRLLRKQEEIYPILNDRCYVDVCRVLITQRQTN